MPSVALWGVAITKKRAGDILLFSLLSVTDGDYSFSAKNFSTSSAALQPLPAATIAWR